MKKNTQRLAEYTRSKYRKGNPGADGERAARQDAAAKRDKNRPFGYYAEEFYGLEEVRQGLLDLQYNYRDEGGPNFKKAAILVEKAQNELLKAGR